ncbi:MAG: hypothetical protein DRR19_24435 [Candidatus Parabeggiatoa sp. nov. 1]|nr:MAG: hypothetical protein DRR19_24435 [Gammaproteobacteria bacterium]
MQRSLGYHFEQKIFNYTGYHPASIQIIVSKYWIVIMVLRLTSATRALSVFMGTSKPSRTRVTAKNNAILTNIRQRGLVDADNQLFARFFEQAFEQD